MKCRVLSVVALFAAVVCFGSVSTAEAQSMRPFSIGVNGGVSIPTGTLSDYTNAGFVFNTRLEVRPWLVPVGLQLEGGWNQWGMKQSFVDDVNEGVDGALDGAHARVLSLSANVVYEVPSVVVKPYVLGGLGMYRVSGVAESGDASLSVTEKKLGFGLGGGVRFVLGPLDATAEVRYHRVKFQDETIAYIPLTIGIRF